MPNNPIKTEIEYVIQDILPIFSTQYGYPTADKSDLVKIQSIPVPMGSGVKKPDIVYYHDGDPVLLVECKREGGSLDKAIGQALTYIHNFPKDKYSKSHKRPKYFAITIGKTHYFFVHQYEIKNGDYDDSCELIDPLSFNELLIRYGYSSDVNKPLLTPEIFRYDLLNELGPLFKTGDKIDKQTVHNVVSLLYSYLLYSRDYVSRRPYTDLDQHKDLQVQVRDLLDRFDWSKVRGEAYAREFREYILRSFQGSDYNQYLTPSTIISFMWELIGQVDTSVKVFDFECGSGGYLVEALKHGTTLNNLLGIDIDELLVTEAKVYLSLYLGITGSSVEDLPLQRGNGLLAHGADWDVVVGNPAGGDTYPPKAKEKSDQSKLDKLYNKKLVLQYLEDDLDQNGREDHISQYNLSIQQAIKSVKEHGKICLVLPDGVFANSSNHILRQLISGNCHVLAIISLPSGAFDIGTDTKGQKYGSHKGNQKMSILFAKKEKCLQDYPIFLASISKPKEDKVPEAWLTSQLEYVLVQYRAWQSKQKLENSIVLSNQKLPQQSELPTVNLNGPLFDESNQEIVPLKPTITTSINQSLKNLFKKT